MANKNRGMASKKGGMAIKKRDIYIYFVFLLYF